MCTLTKPIGTILVLLSIFLFSRPAQAKYGGGSGTAADPYQIATGADLIALGETAEDYDKHFILARDIDLGGHVFDKAVIAPDTDPTEFEYQGIAFTGVFDGNGHTISRLSIQGKDYLGLFGQLGFGADVRNLGVVDVSIVGSGDYVGGLVGRNGALYQAGGIVTRCYSTGTVSGMWSVGGLAGDNNGHIGDSYSSAAVSGKCYVGGLMGRGSATDSYSTGAVSSTNYVGGLVGSGYATNCYSAGTVTGTNYVGGLLGVGSVLLSVWDTETSGLSRSAGGIGLTTAEMMDAYMLGLNGFANDPNWILDAGRDYPRLAWEGTAGDVILEPKIDWLEGRGTTESPYRVDTADQLIFLSRAAVLWDKHFVLDTDIDLDRALAGRQVFGQALIQTFTGVFDGNGHTISNLTITGGSNLGLFGQLESEAQVRDLGLLNVNITGADHIGGLVGYKSGGVTRVTRCYSTGAVSGRSYVGGLVGENWGTVTYCYSSAVVNSTGSDVGGLVGQNAGDVIHCYSTGAVSGNWGVGGLVGRNGARVLFSVWDTQTSGLVGSAGGVSLTTVEMMDPYMLGLNGFGNDPNWVLDAGHDYPRLAWEGTPGGIIPRPDFDWLQGRGTAEDPYQIATAANLIALGGRPQDYDKHFILTADIDVDPNLPGRKVFDKAVIAPDIAETEPGFQGTPFSGVFDGNGHTILHLTIKGGGYVGLFGLFGQWRSGTTVTNLVLMDVNITGSGNTIGGLVGFNFYGDVTKCFSTGKVNGGSTVGGLVGINGGGVTDCCSAGVVSSTGAVGGIVGSNNQYGSVTRCYNSAAVNGTDTVGGLVGENERGPVTGCYSTGAVKGGSMVGGLVGNNVRGPVTDCYVKGGIITGAWYVGGLVGFNSGDVTGCYSTDAVNGGWDVGGLVGYNEGSAIHCYSTGAVNGTREWVGGLVGLNWGSVTGCYSTGAVIGASDVGGLVGLNRHNVATCFWDIQTSGQATSSAGTGKTTAEMQTTSTFLEAGWNFVNIWGIGENQTYPYLRKYSAADINQDASVNFLDLAVFAEDWLTDVSHR